MDYKVIPVNLGKGDQFTPNFKISPNNRMPVIVDHDNQIDGAPLSVFESNNSHISEKKQVNFSHKVLLIEREY